MIKALLQECSQPMRAYETEYKAYGDILGEGESRYRNCQIGIYIIPYIRAELARDSSELQSWRTIYYVSACIAMTPYYIKNMQYIETRVYRFIYCVSMVPPTYRLLVALVL